MRSSIAAAAALLIAFAVWMWWAAAPDPGTDADPAGRAQGTRRSIGREEIDPSTLTPIQVPRDAFEKRAAERAAEAAKRAA
ncbi:MAG TPA: hypothetical protein PKA64_09900, partial [Myxococcota bacterium]|nr:hypothetical protein [Myxococcota bacterium]